MDSATPENPEPQVVFRLSKKRKHFRQRAEESETKPDEATRQAAAPPLPDQDGEAKPSGSHDKNSDNEESSVSEALRLRNAHEVSTEQSLVFKDDPNGADAMEYGVSRRFAPQAGLVGELVNKHMEEYIESELARRHAAEKATEAENLQQQQQSSQPAGSSSADPTKRLGERPTMHGKLQEVDLGEEVRMRNANMTEQARRRLAGEAIEADADGSRKRARIGKDGKPWRGRKRRGSDDIKRDQLVEELMRENRLDVYDVPAQPEASGEPGFDEAADEKIAEQFRREFMDAMSERRQQRRKAAPQPARPGAKQEEVLKGPKLGGSRNARAAMRDLLLSQQEKDKKR
ncbi:mrna splicing factor rna helicase [Diaporthe eres]|nr:mrna splicing factor rna helicase [Diaporthe eres]